MHTILIVDDEPNYQIVLSEILKDEGYEVFTANSGLAGLPIVYSTDLDLVLSDMKMPGMDGIAFLEKIKEYNKTAKKALVTWMPPGYPPPLTKIKRIARQKDPQFHVEDSGG